MTKLEKEIKGLECCILRDPDDKPRCNECPYEGACSNRLKNDALELLKAKQPRVLTLDEVMKHYSLPPVFVDDLNMQEDYLQDIQPLYFEFQPDRPWNVHWFNYDQVGKIYKGITAAYGTVVRAWSAKPTDEQREATPWDEPPKEGESE